MRIFLRLCDQGVSTVIRGLPRGSDKPNTVLKRKLIFSACRCFYKSKDTYLCQKLGDAKTSTSHACFTHASLAPGTHQPKPTSNSQPAFSIKTMVAKGSGGSSGSSGGLSSRGLGISIEGYNKWQNAGVNLGVSLAAILAVILAVFVLYCCCASCLACCYGCSRLLKGRPRHSCTINTDPTTPPKRSWWEIRQRQKQEQDIELSPPPPYEEHVQQPDRARLCPR